MADAAELLAQGKQLARSGKKAEARQLLEQVTELDAYNEDAWVWLAAVVETVEEQQICLENVLLINPNNAKAKAGLASLEGKAGSAPVNGGAGATSAKTKAAAEDTSLDDLRSAFPEPPTATSSASSGYVPPEPSKEDYDSWVQGLNLGGATSGSSVFTTDPNEIDFDDDNVQSVFDAQFGFDDAEEDDEDLLADFPDPFSANTGFGSSSSGGPFTVDVALDDLRQIADDNESFGSAPAKPQRQSPVSPTPAGSSSSSGRGRSGSNIMFTEDIDGDGLDDIDPGEYFREIPDGIKATRLPGTDERYPALLVISLLLLIVLNIGAAALVATKLIG